MKKPISMYAAALIGTCELVDANGDPLERALVVKQRGTNTFYAVVADQGERPNVRWLEVPREDVEMLT